ILGHEADQRFFTSHSQKYSITVEEGNYSTTQRQTELQQLLHFRELGIPIPNKSIMRAAFITNKRQIIQDMEEEQQQQMQQAQQQAQQQERIDDAKIMDLAAKARVSMAKEQDLIASSHERMAKIEDLSADAVYKSSKADLEMVKTMIELEDMDLQNLRANLELAEYIKGVNKAAVAV